MVLTGCLCFYGVYLTARDELVKFSSTIEDHSTPYLFRAMQDSLLVSSIVIHWACLGLKSISS